MRLRRLYDTFGIGAHLCGEESEKAQTLGLVEPGVAVQEFAGDGDAGRLAAAGDEGPGQCLDVIPGVGAEQRLRQQRAALLGDRAQQLLKKRDVQSAVLPPLDFSNDSAAVLPGDCNMSAHMPGAPQSLPCSATAS